VLIDFGTSKELSTEETMALGSASTIILTHGFAAPEQYSPKEQKGTYTDVYAIGATLYNLLTGETPPSSHERYMGHKLDKLNQNSKYYDLIIKAMELVIVKRSDITEIKAVLKGKIIVDHNVINDKPKLEKEFSSFMDNLALMLFVVIVFIVVFLLSVYYK
jgi:serine/threonine protein kinase